MERETGGDDTLGGVPLFEEHGNVARVGSVVRRDVGGRKGVRAGVEEDGATAGVPTVAKELVGLPRPGRLKPRP